MNSYQRTVRGGRRPRQRRAATTVRALVCVILGSAMVGIGVAFIAARLMAGPQTAPCADPFSPDGQVNTSHLYCEQPIATFSP